MTETLLPQLQDPEARQAVVEAVLALFDRWHLHEVNQARLLGVASVSDLKQNKLPADTSGVLRNIGHLLAIDRALSKYFPYEPTARDQWVFVPQKKLADETPLTVMLEQGEEGIRKVRELLEIQLEQ
ncbi:hypothetical protein [Kaarinaea lacus]